jgi:gliding motility-associated lipoprotein GldD
MKQANIYFIVIIFMITSCGKSYQPKPLEYFRIDFPQKNYTTFDSVSCYYKFQYPIYAKIQPYKKETNNCWLNIQFPYFKATIHLTYIKIQNNLRMLTEESRSLAYKHDIKADAIIEILYSDTIHNIYGMVYEIKGNAASPIQFFLTDSSNHFLRGSLYFNVKPNKDSLAPVVAFIKEDIKYLIETLRWK